MSDSQLRWRKFSPIDRDYPIFELVDGDVIVLDVTKDANEKFEISFNQGAVARIFDLGVIERLLAEVKILLSQEEPI